MLSVILKTIVVIALGVALTGRYFFQSWTFGYLDENSFYVSPFPANYVFSETELLRYDGSNLELPLLLAIDGDVFDVSKGRRMYGPGGSYHTMAGRDAARSFVTGCFRTHQTHDLRGFTEDQMKELKGWKDFYTKSRKYHLIGSVSHPPIDPSSPIPPDCKGVTSTETATPTAAVVTETVVVIETVSTLPIETRPAREL